MYNRHQAQRFWQYFFLFPFCFVRSEAPRSGRRRLAPQAKFLGDGTWFITAEKGRVAKAKGEGEKEKECTTECMVLDGDHLYYSTYPRNRNRSYRNHLDHSLSFSQKNRNSLTWVLVALTVSFTYPVLYRVSAESRAGEWEL